MSNEIKQGDKVRVSRDAPRMYSVYKHRGVVKDVDCGCALVESEDRLATDGLRLWRITIPTKYLVKVDAEAKEPKFKKGDKVCINASSLNHGLRGEILTIIGVDVSDKTYWVQSSCMCSPIWLCEYEISLYAEPTAPKIKVGDRVRNTESGLIGVVDKSVYGNVVWVNGADGKRYHWKSDKLELIEPTEQTEAEKKPNVGSIKIPVEIDLSDGYWQAYAANLAKEIALKVANKYDDPKEAAEYAVQVAEAVVAGLKRK